MVVAVEFSNTHLPGACTSTLVIPKLEQVNSAIHARKIDPEEAYRRFDVGGEGFLTYEELQVSRITRFSPFTTQLTLLMLSFCLTACSCKYAPWVLPSRHQRCDSPC